MDIAEKLWYNPPDKICPPPKQGIWRFVSWFFGGGGDMIAGKGGFGMNQQKTGEFLKHLRKDKGMTQEQLAEQFYVSTRTVSRWESGSNMPDLAVLIELADFYDVDIREIIDGERKSDNMDKETKDTLKKVAAYAEEEKKKLKTRVITLGCVSCIVMLICFMLFAQETKGYLYGIVPEGICHTIMIIVRIFGIAAVALLCLYNFGILEKVLERRRRK